MGEGKKPISNHERADLDKCQNDPQMNGKNKKNSKEKKSSVHKMDWQTQNLREGKH